MFNGQRAIRESRQKSPLVLLILAMGLVVLVGGCSKLQSSLDRRDTVTLGDVADRMAALEQRVADLETEAILRDTQGPALPGEIGRLDVRQAGSGDQAIVTAKFLNIRRDPDVQSLHIGTLREGTVVEVIEVAGDWSKVWFSDVTGWVSNEFLERAQ